ncbi:hypothetical protein NE237_033163 [Protea cynaroides]|uniref:Uncharacterized protein n=1 Tax=Protea cynaroides TaxID=273540 RepID=A0A9Q0L6F4_9MAGN|nr:hypothetical protein NE237_033163 [Protea cynaroides]
MPTKFEEQYLDMILVPSGLLVMFIYHLYLAYRVLRYPATTVIGYDTHNWKAWVQKMMEGDLDYVSIALTVININVEAVIFVAFMNISILAFLGVFVGTSGSYSVNSVYIVGSKSSIVLSLKSVLIIFALVVSFGAFILSTRYYVQANSLISMPKADVSVKFVQSALVGGNYLWEVGVRVLYLSVVFMFWSFGPIPMFGASVVTVICLYFMDSNSFPLHQYKQVSKRPVKNVVEEVDDTVLGAVKHRGGKVAE